MYLVFCPRTRPKTFLQCFALEQRHTAGLDTIFIQIYMDAIPGVPGV